MPSAEGNERLALARVSEHRRASSACEAERLQRLETAVGEATMNAMEHGNKYDADLPVTVRVLTDHDRVASRSSTRAAARPSGAPEQPDIDAKLAGLQSPRGWGLFLIKNMVDEAHESTRRRDHTLELMMYLEAGRDPDTADRGGSRP